METSSSSRISKVTLYTILATIFVVLFVISTFFIGFSLPIYILCLFFASVFIFINPEVGLYVIIICTLIFERFFTLQPLVWGENVYKIYPLDILLLVTILSFLVYKIKNPDKKFFISKVGLAILVFVFFSFVSVIYGVVKGGQVSLALSSFKNYAVYAVFFFLIINLIQSRQQFKRLINVFLISGVFLLFFVGAGFIRGAGLWIEYTPLSTLGTRLLAPTHAFYLSLIVLFSLILWVYRKNIFGSFAGILILIQLLGIVGSLARHLWIGLVIAFIVSFLLLKRKYKKNLLKILAFQILIILILVLIYSWFSYLIYGEISLFNLELVKSSLIRLKTLSLAPEDESAYYRLFAWQRAWQLFKEKPIFGIGFGHQLTFDFFGYPTRIEVRELHNDFIGIALQMGIIGLCSFLSILIIFIKSLFGIFKKISQDLRPYLIGTIGGLVLFIISANFGTYFDINLLVIFFWIILGMAVSFENLVKKEIQSNA